jgi:hypothetical protein
MQARGARSRCTSGSAIASTGGGGHGKAGETEVTTDQKGLAQRRAAALPAAVAPAHTSDIELPGGSTVSPGRQPILTVAPPNSLKAMGGSDFPEFNDVLLKSTMATVWNTEPDAAAQRIVAVSAALAAFKPADEIEGMIAAQAVAMHHTAMECFRRSVLPDQPTDTVSKLRKDGANLARGMTDMLDALDRKRGKGGQQVVRVERVVVHEGGQAIVGNVKGGDTAAAVTRPAPSLAIGQDTSGITLDDLVGNQPELVRREGV